jgi:2',3'-cyclic-nucleotide 2'-phosphodiesterase/3'-nucleotidase
VRDLWGLYPYENGLVVLEVTGRQVRALLEHAASQIADARLEGSLVVRFGPRSRSYDFDQMAGVTYRIDPAAPAGRRVRDLAREGRPVRDEDRFTLAANSYRVAGGGGYAALREAQVARTLPGEVRDLLIEKARAWRKLEPACDRNWLIAPDVELSPRR